MISAETARSMSRTRKNEIADEESKVHVARLNAAISALPVIIKTIESQVRLATDDGRFTCRHVLRDFDELVLDSIIARLRDLGYRTHIVENVIILDWT